MKLFRFLLMVSLVGLLCEGCITRVTMTKVTDKHPDPEGLRICLPAKFLVGRLADDTGFTSADIQDLPELLKGLTDNRPVTKYFFAHLDPEVQEKVHDYKYIKVNTTPITSILETKLNQIIGQVPLFDPSDTNRLKGVHLPKVLQDQLNQRQKDTRALIALNVPILTNVYPGSLSSSGQLPSLAVITDAQAFVLALNKQEDGISKFIWGLFKANDQDSLFDTLEKYAKSLSSITTLPEDLARNFLAIIRTKSISTNLFSQSEQVFFTEEAKKLLNLAPKGGEDLARLNRLLIQVAFPAALKEPTYQLIYDVEYLPDPKQEYAISSRAWFAKQKVVIKRSIEMYLTEIDMNQDSTAIAQALAGVGGQLGATALQPSSSKDKNSTNSVQTTTTTTTNSGSGKGAGKQKSSQSDSQDSNDDQSNKDSTDQTSKRDTSSSTTVKTVETKTVLPSARPVVVVYRVIERSGERGKNSKKGDPGGIKLEAVKFPIFDYNFLTNRAIPREPTLLK